MTPRRSIARWNGASLSSETWIVLAPVIVTTAQAAAARANRVSVSYVPQESCAQADL
jgi:hypothetical protein